jgi:hypothetical protein
MSGGANIGFGIAGALMGHGGALAFSKAKPPDAPNIKYIAKDARKLAEENYKLALENMNRARQQDAKNDALLSTVLEQQIPMMRASFGQARRDRERYEREFMPFEKQLMADANSYTSGARVSFERGRAMADMATAQEQQRKNALQNLESYGVDPSQTRYAAIDRAARLSEAANIAQAGTNAASQAENTGRALRADVIGLGQGTLDRARGTTQDAANIGNSAVGNALNAAQTSIQGRMSAVPYMGLSLEGYGTETNILNADFANRMNKFEAKRARIADVMNQNWKGYNAAAGAFGMGGGEDGGEVPHDLKAIPGPGDTVPAMLEPGEFVIPKEVVAAKGTEFFERLTEKHAPHKAKRKALPSR